MNTHCCMLVHGDRALTNINVLMVKSIALMKNYSPILPACHLRHCVGYVSIQTKRLSISALGVEAGTFHTIISASCTGNRTQFQRGLSRCTYMYMYIAHDVAAHIPVHSPNRNRYMRLLQLAPPLSKFPSDPHSY